MSHDSYSIHELVAMDPRYPLEAYLFVKDALAFASDSMELGACQDPDLSFTSMANETDDRHLTGQQLCEAIRKFALNQFGYMAQIVLASWNIHETSHFGDLVYNMISVGEMKKSSHDRRSHFDDVFDFDEVFTNDFEICCSSLSSRRR